jgi:hypothetical protein
MKKINFSRCAALALALFGGGALIAAFRFYSGDPYMWSTLLGVGILVMWIAACLSGSGKTQ